MTNIIIYDLHPTDVESFITDINDLNHSSIFGGEDDDKLYQTLKFGLLTFAIYTITQLVKEFISE